ncbi:MAG TPA: 1-aminocyclopropane-1-carboxylate deaminase/D-cysteine desulfhydrase [Pricia sp.]|uniref:1-aminocyclopropane-1-carboxylate deaminase/D-cysteine desulfhydrase n=2 Tax=root TaxID=1 RepID=A0A831VU03_9FLAO|nr:1-aminocyclopropane-1-carboxylate deaminase/D-cysteine desulfhydrase [Pricia sp.]HEA20104.1 1-aminocyclopropane-1-carboxylate deaminase/D-cysteine desulfhydrase [Pricia antarctica]
MVNQKIALPLLAQKQISLSIKSEDLIHPLISGNKFRKLKYNLIAAKKQGLDTILTFGGAYSNHIAATAYSGKLHGFKTIGVIRGEELSLKWEENPTLKLASDHGMQFKFVSRAEYRDKEKESFLKPLQHEFGAFFILPEGGTNTLAVLGCSEIVTAEDSDFNVICCSVGTGGTLSGISNATFENQRVLGFPAVKSGFLNEDICKFAQRDTWELIEDYHFGGYAKVTAELIDFINSFKAQTQIPLDPIYTGKMIYGILDLVGKDYFPPKTKILAIHTGGLQGIKGMNILLKKKNLPVLSV